MTLQEIQYKAQSIIHKWRDDDSAPYIEFVEELAHMIVPEQSEDLEEAAEEYEKRVIEETKCHHNALTYAEGYEDALLLIPGAFIAGAKWQKQHDAELIEIAYNDGITIGMTKQKEQMMEEAVEGYVSARFGTISIPHNIYDRYDGQKVKLIIVKED